MLMQTRRITDDNLNILTQCREEVNKLLTQQLKYLDEGFDDLIRRLHEKKQYFAQNFDQTYKLEDQKFVTLQNTFEDYQHEMSLIEKVFVELIEFVD